MPTPKYRLLEYKKGNHLLGYGFEKSNNLFIWWGPIWEEQMFTDLCYKTVLNEHERFAALITRSTPLQCTKEVALSILFNMNNPYRETYKGEKIRSVCVEDTGQVIYINKSHYVSFTHEMYEFAHSVEELRVLIDSRQVHKEVITTPEVHIAANEVQMASNV